MYRSIVLLCVLVLSSGSLACVESDEDDDFDQDDSTIAEDDESEEEDVARSGDGDSEGAGGDDHVAEESDDHVAEEGADEDRGERDVAGVQLSFFNLWEDETSVVLELDLDEGTLSPDFLRELPLVDDSQHHYVYLSTALLLGGYDVEARAIDEHGEVIDECSSPVARKIGELPSDWVQVFLLIQCDQTVGMAAQSHDLEQIQAAQVGDSPPDFDVELIIAFNYAPVIETVEVHPSTTQKCPATAQVCATVVDPDNDPVAFEWTQVEGPEPLAGPREIGFEEEDGVIESCVEYDLLSQDADYSFELNVFDQIIDDDTPIDIEHWYGQEGYGDIESRDNATVNFDVYCPEEKKDPEKPDEDADEDADEDDGGQGDANEDKPVDDPILDGIMDKHFGDQKRKIKSWLWRIDDEEKRTELQSIVDSIDDPDKLQSIVDAITNGESLESVIDKIYELK